MDLSHCSRLKSSVSWLVKILCVSLSFLSAISWSKNLTKTRWPTWVGRLLIIMFGILSPSPCTWSADRYCHLLLTLYSRCLCVIKCSVYLWAFRSLCFVVSPCKRSTSLLSVRCWSLTVTFWERTSHSVRKTLRYPCLTPTLMTSKLLKPWWNVCGLTQASSWRRSLHSSTSKVINLYISYLWACAGSSDLLSVSLQ